MGNLSYDDAYNQVMVVLLQHIAALTKSDGAAFAVYSNEKVVFRSAWGNYKSLLGKTLPLDHSLSALAAKSKTILYSNNIDQDHRVWQYANDTFHIKSLIVLPLFMNDELVGFVNLSSNEADHYNDDFKQSLQDFAPLAIAAMKDATKYAESQIYVSGATTRSRDEIQSQLQAYEMIQFQMLNKLPFIWFLWDVQRQSHLYINRESLTLLGYTQEQILQLPPDTYYLVHPDDISIMKETQARYTQLKDNEYEDLVVRMLCSDGRYRRFLIRCSVYLRDTDGKVAQLAGLTINLDDLPSRMP